MLARVQQLLSRALQQVSDCVLRNSILKMGINPTEGELLLCVLARQLECGVCEPPVVAMVVLYCDSVLCCKALESHLGLDRLVG